MALRIIIVVSGLPQNGITTQIIWFSTTSHGTILKNAAFLINGIYSPGKQASWYVSYVCIQISNSPFSSSRNFRPLWPRIRRPGLRPRCRRSSFSIQIAPVRYWLNRSSRASWSAMIFGVKEHSSTSWVNRIKNHMYNFSHSLSLSQRTWRILLPFQAGSNNEKHQQRWHCLQSSPIPPRIQTEMAGRTATTETKKKLLERRSCHW